MSDTGSDSLTPSGEDSEDDSSTETGETSDEFELNNNATLSNVSLGQKKSVAVDAEHYDEAMELSASEQSVMSDAGPGAGTESKVKIVIFLDVLSHKISKSNQGTLKIAHGHKHNTKKQDACMSCRSRGVENRLLK